jgi:GDP-L-fucose synthase
MTRSIGTRNLSCVKVVYMDNFLTSNPNQSYWHNKRVLVTGGHGFLGSFVVNKLRQREVAEIITFRSNEYDLTNVNAIDKLFDDLSMPVSGHGGQDKLQTVVIHLAALAGGIGANRKAPAEFFYKNLMMGVPFLHKAWERGVSKFVVIGTICAYPKDTPIPFNEQNLWDGYPEETNAPYGLAKKMLLVQAQAYRQQYGFNSIYLLPVNLYGPRDNFDLETSHVIPALIRKCLEARIRQDERVVVWGDGSPTREFLYVEDAAEGILMSTERYNGSEPVNLGSGSEIRIKDLVELIARMTGYKGEIFWDTSKPNGQPRRALDITRAQKYFGFHARTPFEEGLRRTIDWYLKNYGNDLR